MRFRQVTVAAYVFLGVAAICGWLARGSSGDRRRSMRVDGIERTSKFVNTDHCSAALKKEHIPDVAGDGTTSDIAIYSGCAGESEVRGQVIDGGGHTWPGATQYLPAAFIGKTTHNLDGSEVIWEFPSSHRR
jgi:poly(3-hydroxybutyrate) depolymerase